jgi:hypothetical protein
MKHDDRDREEPADDQVCVFRTGDEEIANAAKAVLDGEEIRYVARNVELQELFGAGRGGGGINFAVGSVDFLVSREDAERARGVLNALREGFLRGDGAGNDSGE